MSDPALRGRSWRWLRTRMIGCLGVDGRVRAVLKLDDDGKKQARPGPVKGGKRGTRRR